MKKLRTAYGGLFFLLLVTEVLIALFVRDQFVRPYVGDLLVTLLLCCLCRIFVPKGVPLLPFYVFLFAATVELTQAIDILALLGLDGNRLLSILLGRTFSVPDLICYAFGCIVFWGISRLFHRLWGIS